MFLRLRRRRRLECRIDSELDSLCSGSRPEIVHSCLQSLLPSVEMHACQLPHRRGLQVDVQRLTLADEGPAVGCEVEDFLLGDLPDGFVDRLDVVGDTLDALDGPVIGDD